MRAMARTDPQVNVRLPAQLKASLDEAALKAGRSLTAEIVFRLYSSFNEQRSSREETDHYAALFGKVADVRTKEDELVDRLDSRIRYLDALTERLAFERGKPVDDGELELLKKAITDRSAD